MVGRGALVMGWWGRVLTKEVVQAGRFARGRFAPACVLLASLAGAVAWLRLGLLQSFAYGVGGPGATA